LRFKVTFAVSHACELYCHVMMMMTTMIMIMILILIIIIVILPTGTSCPGDWKLAKCSLDLCLTKQGKTCL